MKISFNLQIDDKPIDWEEKKIAGLEAIAAGCIATTNKLAKMHAFLDGRFGAKRSPFQVKKEGGKIVGGVWAVNGGWVYYPIGQEFTAGFTWHKTCYECMKSVGMTS